MKIPKRIISGYHGSCHCQGIAVDLQRGYIYYSFTTKLIKSDFKGNIIGTVENLTGHLGCIDFQEADGRVYGSLEYKNDCIGKGIHNALGLERENEEAFYCAIFDVDNINRIGMDAEKDGVMKAVYLQEVVKDYLYPGHKYGCSGIDGTAWGPVCGQKDKKEYLHIAYGIYGDTKRTDNDCQVILCYDAEDWWDTYAQPLSQSDPHKNGPQQPFHKFFLQTGNTEWGIQNLEYDSHSGDYYAAVYKGKKTRYKNYDMFVIDGSAAPAFKDHPATGEKVEMLQLKPQKGEDGMFFPYGSTGMFAVGDGRFLFSIPAHHKKHGHATTVRLYKKTDNAKKVFRRFLF
ncbi:MAG: hypothetical protein E7523_11220 [Ruminococcaceae bacterium]|nr:hypothetical protein [Oscillospiraceae bacterium]